MPSERKKSGPSEHKKTAGREWATGGRKGPPRRPGNEIEDHGNIARAGGGQRKDRSTMSRTATPSPRPGARAEPAARRSGPTAKRNAASQPRG